MSEKNMVVAPTADFWVRVGAALLDGVIIFGSFFILSIPVAILVPIITKSAGPAHDSTVLALVFSAVYLGIPCLYITLSTAIWGQTLGKKAFSLKVVRMDGTKVGFFRSLWRWVWGLISAIPLCLGFLVAALQKDKRALHDLVAGTKVVMLRPSNLTALIVLLCLIPVGTVPVIGILAAIAIPRFAQMLEKSREGETKGNLGSLKSAVAIYYGDTSGKWPVDLEKDLVPKYLDAIPQVKATGAFVAGADSPAGGQITMGKKGQVPTGSGSGWLYDSSSGDIYVNSTVKDSKGVPYSFYGFE